GQSPLVAGERPGGVDRGLVLDGDDLIEHVQVEDAGNEPGADALDLVRPRTTARQKRRRARLDRNPAPRAVAGLEKPAGAGDRAAGADTDDEGADPPAKRIPDLRAGRPTVDL